MTYVREPMYELSFRFRRILVPVDGSELSLRALELALDLARRYGSRITVLHVKPTGANEKQVLDKVKERIENKGIPVSIKVREINPVKESIAKKILDELAEESYDIVVLGARGLTVSEELNIGSTALTVAINSTTTTIIVR